MSKPLSAANPSSLPSPAPAPVRSPRTSIILAELARQRRYERRQRRLRRRQRRRTSTALAGWLAALAWLSRLERRPGLPRLLLRRCGSKVTGNGAR